MALWVAAGQRKRASVEDTALTMGRTRKWTKLTVIAESKRRKGKLRTDSAQKPITTQPQLPSPENKRTVKERPPTDRPTLGRDYGGDGGGGDHDGDDAA